MRYKEGVGYGERETGNRERQKDAEEEKELNLRDHSCGALVLHPTSTFESSSDI